MLLLNFSLLLRKIVTHHEIKTIVFLKGSLRSSQTWEALELLNLCWAFINLKLFLGLPILVYEYVCFAFVYVYAAHAYLLFMESERKPDPLKWELHIVVSHVGAGNQRPQVFCNSNK